MDEQRSAKIFELETKTLYIIPKEKKMRKVKKFLKAIKAFLKNSKKDKATLLFILACAKPKQY